MKALRKEPERRYTSVAQFSDDLGRFLQNLPVHARKESLPLPRPQVPEAESGSQGGRGQRRRYSRVLGLGRLTRPLARVEAGIRSIAGAAARRTFRVIEEQEYFADGMTDALISDLTRIPGLAGDLAHFSNAAYKGARKRLPEIARNWVSQRSRKVRSFVPESGPDCGAPDRRTEGTAGLERQLRRRDFGMFYRMQSQVAGAIAGGIDVTLTAPRLGYQSRRIRG